MSPIRGRIRTTATTTTILRAELSLKIEVIAKVTRFNVRNVKRNLKFLTYFSKNENETAKVEK